MKYTLGHSQICYFYFSASLWFWVIYVCKNFDYKSGRKGVRTMFKWGGGQDLGAQLMLSEVIPCSPLHGGADCDPAEINCWYSHSSWIATKPGISEKWPFNIF